MKQIKDFYLRHQEETIRLVSSILIGLFAVLSNTSFDLNPFIVLSFLIALNSTFLVMSLSLIFNSSLAFPVSFFYGIDVALSLSLLLILVLLIRSKNNPVVKMIPITIFILVMNAFYLIPHYSTTLLIKLLRNDLSIIVFALTINLKTSEKQREMTSILPLISLALMPRLFNLFNMLELAFTYLITLLLFYREKSPYKRYSFLLFLFLNFYYIETLSLESIFTIITPLLLVALFNNEALMLLSFLVLTELPLIILEPTMFFKRANFIAPLVALLSYAIFKTYLSPAVIPSDDDTRLKAKLRKVQDYLELLEKSHPDPNLEKRNLEENLRIKPCKTCLKKSDCLAVSSLASNLPNKIYKPYKENILKTCPNGGKLVYRYQVVRDMVENELRLNSKNQEEQRLVSGLISPLKTICDTKKEELTPFRINSLLKDEAVKGFTADVLSTTRSLTGEEIALLEDELDLSIDPHYRYIIYSSLYLYHLRSNRRYRYKVSYFTKSYSESGGGDLYYELKGESEDEIFLLDAMGHQEEASSYARFGLSFLVESKNIFPLIKDRLQETNLVLKYHSRGENYLVMDLLRLDKKTGTSKLIKLGSAPSFLMIDQTIKKIENIRPPLGILSDLDYEEEPIDLDLNSKLILTTDGFEHFEEYLSSIEPRKRDDIRTLSEGYLEKYPQSDDLSIALVSLDLID